MNVESETSRRDLLASLAMGIGLLLAYGTMAAQGLLFLLPKRLQPKTRLLFAGRIDRFEVGTVKMFSDLDGNPILVKRDDQGFRAFNSTCPHLGCRVHWEEENRRFFCPCHRGVFDENGVATAGPPADAGQNLAPVNLRVDEQAGVLYVEVRAKKGRTA